MDLFSLADRKVLQRRSAVAGADGVARVSFDPVPVGAYKLRATARFQGKDLGEADDAVRSSAGPELTNASVRAEPLAELPGSPAAGPTSSRWGRSPTCRCSTHRWSRWAGARMRRSGTAGAGWWRWRCCWGRSGCCAAASATSKARRSVVEPARLPRKALRPLHSTAAPTPGLGHAPSTHRPDPEVTTGVPDPVAAGATRPGREVVGRSRPAPVLHDQGQRGSEPHLPAGIDVDGLASRSPGPNEVHPTQEGLLLDQRAGAAVAFHGAHPIRED